MRYIHWFITFPLLLLELFLAISLSLPDIMTTLFVGIGLVICRLVGALMHSDYRWS
jgi:bacteriorhodopsin